MEDNEQEGIDLNEVNLTNEEDVELDIDNEIDNVDDNEDTVKETEIKKEDNQSETNNDDDKDYLKKGLNYERKQRKLSEKKIKELEEQIKELQSNKEPDKTTEEELVAAGIDVNVAKTIAKQMEKKSPDTKAMQRQIEDLNFKLDLERKSKEEGFTDITEYADDIRELVGKGLTMEQAYGAATYGKEKSSRNTKSEIERKVEAKMKNTQARKDILGNVNSNAGTAVQSNSEAVKATSAEIAIAKQAGMSIEDYLAAKNSSSLKNYNNYVNKKAK